jgi:hypothetical protein
MRCPRRNAVSRCAIGPRAIWSFPQRFGAAARGRSRDRGVRSQSPQPSAVSVHFRRTTLRFVSDMCSSLADGQKRGRPNPPASAEAPVQTGAAAVTSADYYFDSYACLPRLDSDLSVAALPNASWLARPASLATLAAWSAAWQLLPLRHPRGDAEGRHAHTVVP